MVVPFDEDMKVRQEFKQDLLRVKEGVKGLLCRNHCNKTKGSTDRSKNKNKGHSNKG